MSDDGWIALGLELTLWPSEAGGRRMALGPVPYVPWGYRPNWVLSQDPEYIAAGPMLCLAPVPVVPGGHARAVIVPLFDETLPRWRQVQVGDELLMHEGKPRGTGIVAWVAPTEQRTSADDEALFGQWAHGGEAPPV